MNRLRFTIASMAWFGSSCLSSSCDNPCRWNSEENKDGGTHQHSEPEDIHAHVAGDVKRESADCSLEIPEVGAVKSTSDQCVHATRDDERDCRPEREKHRRHEYLNRLLHLRCRTSRFSGFRTPARLLPRKRRAAGLKYAGSVCWAIIILACLRHNSSLCEILGPRLTLPLIKKAKLPMLWPGQLVE